MPDDATAELKNTYAQLRKDQKEITNYQEEQGKLVKLLMYKHKGLIKQQQKMKKPKEPIAYLFRTNKQVEIYEGITGSTWIIPKPEGQEKIFGDDTQVKVGRRIARLAPSDLHRVTWGTDSVKAYFINEEDSAPFNAKPQVFSERLEYTIDALLVALNKLQTPDKSAELKQWVKIVMWVAIAIIGGLLVKGMFFPTPAAQVIANNVSVIANHTAQTITTI